MDFFRFPHTPHLSWLGEHQPRQDKVLADDEVRELLAHEVVVEEKIDGANVGISLDETGALRLQNRGTYLSKDSAHPQFAPLFRWVGSRRASLTAVLEPGLILFGEWCYAQHSIHYTHLPDWFLAFDVYDTKSERFWATERRDDLVHRAGVSAVPELARGRFDIGGLEKLTTVSRFADGPAEGVYVRWDEHGWLRGRAKLVRKEFVQAIGEHWSRRNLVSNSLAVAGHAGTGSG